MKSGNPLKIVITQANMRAICEPRIPKGEMNLRAESGTPCALRARTKKMCDTRMEIQVRIPKMVTRETRKVKA